MPPKAEKKDRKPRQLSPEALRLRDMRKELTELRLTPADQRSQQQSARIDQLKQDTKRLAFRLLAAKRVRNAIKALNNVSRCGNTAAYSYTDEEAAKICATIREYAESVADAFGPKKSAKTVFDL